MQKISDWLRLVVFLVFLMPVTGCANIFQPDIPISLMSNPDKMAYDYFSIRGVNIGNALDAPEPGQWGVQIKPVYFQAIKEAGFNTVRVPIRFSAHTGNKPPYSIDDDFLKIIQETAKNGLDAELIVILDFHHFDEVMVDPDKNEEKLLSLWNQISYLFSSYSERLYFEILNEPSGDLNADRWNSLSARIISVIRKNDPHRKIIVDAAEFSNSTAVSSLNLPSDKNLIVTFHFYDPFEFTHQGADWVNGSNRWLGKTWNGTEEEKKLITDKLDQVAEWSANNQIPVLMGEFGTIEQADRASRIRWTDFLARETEKRRIGWVYWQFCSNFAVYSCENEKWDIDLLGALIPVNTSK